MHPLLTVLQWGPGSVPIGGYGAMLALAVVAGSALSLRAAVARGLESGAVVSTLGAGVGGAFFGGWLVSFLVTACTRSPAVAWQRPGLVLYGAAFVGLFSLWVAARAFRVSLPALLDAGVPALALSQALGRVGCLLGGCCFGAPAVLPWAVTYDHPLAPAAQLPQPLHPWPAYEALYVLVLGYACRRLPLHGARAGARFALYALLCSLGRFALEPLRGDSVRGVLPSGASTSQLLSALAACAAFGYLLRARHGALASAALLLVAVWALPGGAGARTPAAAQRWSARARIDGGAFSMGSTDDEVGNAALACALGAPDTEGCDATLFDDERPVRRLWLRAFEIDRTEVSNAAYERCVAAGACAPSGVAAMDLRIGYPEQPVVLVRFGDAQRYCRHVGGALPTEAQWERAARGASARLYPWGNAWNHRLANHGAAHGGEDDTDGYRYAAPVWSFPDGRSVHGLLHMAGNVWELVADRYRASYDADERIEPAGPESGDERVVRGGSWRSPQHRLRVRARGRVPEAERRPDVGFRCAYPVAFAGP